MRLPLLLALLATLLLLTGIGLLLANQQVQSGNSDRQEVARELSETTEQLSLVVASGSDTTQVENAAANNTKWAQSDQLARLVAAGDVQVKELIESYGALDRLSGYDDAAAHEVNADWKMIREGLLSFNRSVQTVAQPEPQPEIQQPVAQDPPSIEVPESVLLLAADFEQIRARVTEGTREQSLIDVVNNSSLMWTQIVSSDGVDLQALVAEQQSYADELLQLSGAGTGNSLYGYYTSEQILQFVQRVKDIQLPAPVLPANDSSAVSEPVVNEQNPVEVASSAFVTEALLQLQASIAKFLDANTATRSSLINWLALASLATALLIFFTAFGQMMRTSRALRSLDIRENDVATRASASRARATRAPVSELIVQWQSLLAVVRCLSEMQIS